jgi:signal transduction histidine kinase
MAAEELSMSVMRINSPEGGLSPGREDVKPSFFRGFRSRLLGLIMLSVIPSLVLALYTNLEQRKLGRAQVKDQAVLAAQLAAAKQEGLIDSTRQLLAALAELPQFRGTNRFLYNSHFANLLKFHPQYVDFGLIETNGDLFSNAFPVHGPVSFADQTSFRRALKTLSFAIGDLQTAGTTNKLRLDFAHPVLDENERLIRIMYASVDLDVLKQVAAHATLPPGATLALIDRGGHILASYPEAAQIGESLLNSPLAEAILTRKEGTAELPGLDNKPRLHAFTAIRRGPEASLFVNVSIPEEIAYAAANQILRRNLAVLSLVVVIVLAAAQAYAARFLLHPIDALVRVARRLAKGDLQARAGHLTASSELNHLAHAFDDMAETLQKEQSAAAKTNQALREGEGRIRQLNAELEQRVAERTAQLKAANFELEAFSYSVSHDLRAPLRHIDGFVALLGKAVENNTNAQVGRYLKIISESAKQMGRLIDDLLVFSRTGRLEMQCGFVDFELLAAAVIRDLQPETQGRNVIWKQGPLPKAHGDQAMLRQVLVNLIDNAIKYTRPRDPAQIEIGCSNGHSDQTVIYVRDNGVGFDMRYVKKLFGVFQRLHRADEFEGTGIGLANVQRIIHRHGGRAWAEGKLDEGATFYFSLPHARLGANGKLEEPTHDA